MSRSLDLGINATGSVSFNFACSTLDYPLVTAKESGNTSDSLTLVNTQSPSDRVNKIIVKTQLIDVYKGKSINAQFRSPNPQGIQVMIRREEIWSELESTDATLRYDLPIDGWMVIKVPFNALVDDTALQGFIGRLIGTLFQSDRAATPAAVSRISSLIRRAIVPDGI